VPSLCALPKIYENSGRERRCGHRALSHRRRTPTHRTHRRSRHSTGSTSRRAAGVSCDVLRKESRSLRRRTTCSITSSAWAGVSAAPRSRGRRVAQYATSSPRAEYQPAVRSLETLFAAGHMPMEIGEAARASVPYAGRMERLDWRARGAAVRISPTSPERVAMMHRVAEIAEDKAAILVWRSCGCSAPC